MYASSVILFAGFSVIAAQSCGTCLDNSGGFAEISSPIQLDCSQNQGCGNSGPIILGPGSLIPQQLCNNGPFTAPGPVVIPGGPFSSGSGSIISGSSNQASQQNVVLSNNCNCVKTVVRPKLVSTVVSVPSESQSIQTFTRPVQQTINYQYTPPLNAGPSVPSGPIIDGSSFVSSASSGLGSNAGSISGINVGSISGINAGSITGCNAASTSGCTSGCAAQQFLCR